MTTIIAVRKHNRTCIVSDSLVVYGERRKEAYGTLIAEYSKLFFWENAVIGISGSSTWKLAVLDFLHTQKKTKQPSSIETLLACFSKLWRSFRADDLLASTGDENAHYFSPCRIIVATQSSIFKLTIEGAIVRNENVVAIGGGYPFAYGAVRAIDSHSESPFDIAMVGIRAAAAWDPDTQGPFFGWHISEHGVFSEFSSVT